MTEYKQISIELAFEKMILTMINQLCISNQKEPLIRQKSELVGTKYFMFDAYAPKGIEDDTPTYIEIKRQLNHSKLKQILDSYSSFSESILLIVDGDVDITNLQPPGNVKVWGSQKIDEILNKYPVDYLAYYHAIKPYLNSQQLQTEDSRKTRLNIEPSKEAFDKSKEDKIRELSVALKSGNINFVLGAGISKEFGADSWNELLVRIEKVGLPYVDDMDAVKKIVGNDAYTIPHFVKHLLGEKGKSSEYAKSIYSGLYCRLMCFGDGEHSNTTLHSLTRYIMKVKQQKIKVLTYNYDNFFEQQLIKQKFSNYKSIWKYSDLIVGKDLPIYHVHGFLPFMGKIKTEDITDYAESLIFSADEYMELYKHYSDWRVGIQSTIFSDQYCLFIGSSITDYHQRMMLKNTKSSIDTRYAFLCESDSLTLKDKLSIYGFYKYEYGVVIIWISKPQEVREYIDEIVTDIIVKDTLEENR